MKYVGIYGGNSKKSTNKKLLNYIKKRFSSKNVTIELAEIGNLPVFYKTKDKLLPKEVQELDNKIEKADGVIIATPEYDHAVPAVLMNALEWTSFVRHPFVGKPVMIVGASYGTLGASRAQAHLRQIFDATELQACIMPSSEFLVDHSLQAFDDEGMLRDDEKIMRLGALFNNFENFTKIIQQLNESHKNFSKFADDLLEDTK